MTEEIIRHVEVEDNGAKGDISQWLVASLKHSTETCYQVTESSLQKYDVARMDGGGGGDGSAEVAVR